jgi:hypothetical protein
MEPTPPYGGDQETNDQRSNYFNSGESGEPKAHPSECPETLKKVARRRPLSKMSRAPEQDLRTPSFNF